MSPHGPIARYWFMNPGELYIHDAQLFKVMEDAVAQTLTFEVTLPLLEFAEQQFHRKLVFDDSYNYQVHEQPWEGNVTILGIAVTGNDGWRHQVRIETNAGYRTFYCASLSVVE